MTAIRTAQTFISDAPREAIVDIAGFGAMCLLIFAGFTLPAFL